MKLTNSVQSIHCKKFSLMLLITLMNNWPQLYRMGVISGHQELKLLLLESRNHEFQKHYLRIMRRLSQVRLSGWLLNKNNGSNRSVSLEKWSYKKHVFVICKHRSYFNEILIVNCIEAETKRLEAKIEAESHAEVNKIEMDK